MHSLNRPPRGQVPKRLLLYYKRLPQRKHRCAVSTPQQDASTSRKLPPAQQHAQQHPGKDGMSTADQTLAPPVKVVRTLTSVERTAVQVAWYRWKAAYLVSDKHQGQETLQQHQAHDPQQEQPPSPAAAPAGAGDSEHGAQLASAAAAAAGNATSALQQNHHMHSTTLASLLAANRAAQSSEAAVSSSHELHPSTDADSRHKEVRQGSGVRLGQLLYDPSFDQRIVDSAMEPGDMQELMDREPERRALMMAGRTVSLDDAVMRATGGPMKQPGLPGCATPQAPIKQVVILGAGLDARAWRLPWPPGVIVFEVDTGSVEALKQQVLGPLPIKCAARHALKADLGNTQAVEQALQDAGYNTSAPTMWLMEGLVGYLERDDTLRLLKWMLGACAAGSQLVITCPPSPAFHRQAAAENWKLHHTTFEEPEETLARVHAAGWGGKLVIEAQLQDTYHVPCWQPQVHAFKA